MPATSAGMTSEKIEPMRLSAFLAAAMIFATLHGASAATRMNREPAEGDLRPGQKVLVDDGTCPVGQIKEVTGGSNRNQIQTAPAAGMPRQRQCVKR